MTFPHSNPVAVHLFRYKVASADMYYSEFEERDVFIGIDEHGQTQIWGKTADGKPSTKITLCEIFLEYGLYCCSWCDTAEGLYHMQHFGELLGHRLANYLADNPILLTTDRPAVHALESVFESIGACFSTEYTEAQVRLVVTDCPLGDTAKRSGLSNVEFAHHGINAMCRTLVVDLEPGVMVEASQGIRPEFVLTIQEPVAA